MVKAQEEKRRFNRIFFSLADGIEGTFTFTNFLKGTVTAYIINLSEGGVGLVLNKEKDEKRIEKGEALILTQINGIQGLEPLMNIEAEIKWILDNPSLEFLGFGCEFLRMPESLQAHLRAFIDSWCSGKIGSRSKGIHY
jgi:c-di-GMP-binding flagellar brake protein YcgR